MLLQDAKAREVLVRSRGRFRVEEDKPAAEDASAPVAAGTPADAEAPAVVAPPVVEASAASTADVDVAAAAAADTPAGTPVWALLHAPPCCGASCVTVWPCCLRQTEETAAAVVDESELVDSSKLEAILEETTKELDRVIAEKVMLARASIVRLARLLMRHGSQDALLAQGFPTFSKNNYRAFVAACERHGRRNKEAIYAEVCETADKDMATVKRYYKVFWERYQELSEWKRVIERIDKGEQKIKVRFAMRCDTGMRAKGLLIGARVVLFTAA
jgi:hypothetical protein